MNWRCRTIVFIFLLCSSFVSSQETLEKTISHNELEREYILYIPASYVPGKSVPLLYNFHGYTSNAFQQMNYGDFRSIADSVNFIIVHPLGTRDAVGNTHFNVGWGGSTVDDLSFTEALLDTIAANYSIDLNRVYSTGMSNGGFMSYHIACNLSEKFAAIASVTGSMSPLTFNSCNPKRPVPILEIHGTEDGVVPYDGAIFSTPIDDVIDYWTLHNNCALTPIVSDIEDINTADNSTVTLYEYVNGDQQVNTNLFKITSGTHTWPSNPFIASGTNFDIDASLEVWKFFDQYDLNGLRTTTSTANPDINPLKLYPNPIQEYLTIETNSSEVFDIEILDFHGRSLLSEKGKYGDVQLDLSFLSNGIYILKIGEVARKILKQ